MNTAPESVRRRIYKVQEAVGLYSTSGTSDDYAFSRHIINEENRKIYGFTIEFGKEVTGFIHPFLKCEVWIRPKPRSNYSLSLWISTI